MIKSMKLHNFQSHDETKLEFDKHVNVIVGLSDSGKSSIIRALNAGLFNDKFYVRTGMKSGSIEIEFDDTTLMRQVRFQESTKCPDCKGEIEGDVCVCGTVITDKISSNVVVLDGEKFEKYGTKYPEEILRKIKIFPLKFIDFEEDINLSNQDDDMFFIGQTYAGSNRNKILSSLIPNSDKIDIIIKNTSSDIQKKTSEIGFLEKETLATRAILTEHGPTLELLKFSLGEYKSASELIKATKAKIEKLRLIQGEFQANKWYLEIGPKIKKLADVLVQLNQKMEKAKALVTKVSTLKSIKSEYKHLEKFEFKTFEIDLQKLSELKRNIMVLKSAKVNLKADVDFKTRLQLIIKEAELDITDKHVEFNEWIEKEAVCPITKKAYCRPCQEVLKHG